MCVAKASRVARPIPEVAPTKTAVEEGWCVERALLEARTEGREGIVMV